MAIAKRVVMTAILAPTTLPQEVQPPAIFNVRMFRWSIV